MAWYWWLLVAIGALAVLVMVVDCYLNPATGEYIGGVYVDAPRRPPRSEVEADA